MEFPIFRCENRKKGKCGIGVGVGGVVGVGVGGERRGLHSTGLSRGQGQEKLPGVPVHPTLLCWCLAYPPTYKNPTTTQIADHLNENTFDT